MVVVAGVSQLIPEAQTVAFAATLRAQRRNGGEKGGLPFYPA